MVFSDDCVGRGVYNHYTTKKEARSLLFFYIVTLMSLRFPQRVMTCGA